VFEDHAVGADLAGVPGQVGQEGELPGGEVEGASVHAALVMDQVQRQGTDHDRRGLVLTVLVGTVSQGHTQAGLELAHAERLGHVVVGPPVEGGDLAVFGPVGRQHDDRDSAPLPDAAADLEAVHVR
jgi:hypothetical protein